MFAQFPIYQNIDDHEIYYIVVDKSTTLRDCLGFLELVSPLALRVIHIQPKLSYLTYGNVVVYEVN